MDCPVNLDDHAGLEAVEIDDEAFYRMLAAELRIRDLPVADCLPEGIFSARGCVTHLAREWFEFGLEYGRGGGGDGRFVAFGHGEIPLA